MKKCSYSHEISPSLFDVLIIPLFQKLFNHSQAKSNSLHHYRFFTAVCEAERKPSPTNTATAFLYTNV